MQDAAHDRALDGLRGVSATVVVVGHAFAGVFGQLYPAWALLAGWCARVAVIVFFVLSGYVILLSVRRMIDAGGFSTRQFAINRMARIYPPFFLSLALVWFIAILAAQGFLLPKSGFPVLEVMLGPFVFLRDAVFLFGNGTPAQMINGPIWSLRLEVACYILTALCVAALGQSGMMRIVPLVLAFAFAVAVLLRLEGAWLGFLAFSAGGAAALRPQVAGYLPAAGIAGATLAAAALAFYLTGATGGKFEPHWSYVLFQLFAIGLALSLIVRSGAGLRYGQPTFARLHRLADGSYTLFITHYPVMICVAALWVEPAGFGGRLLLFVVLVAAAFGFALPAARLFEQQKRFRAWLDRLLPRRAQPLTGARS